MNVQNTKNTKLSANIFIQLSDLHLFPDTGKYIANMLKIFTLPSHTSAFWFLLFFVQPHLYCSSDNNFMTFNGP